MTSGDANNTALNGSAWVDIQARKALPILVRWVEEGAGRPELPLHTYKDLALQLHVHHRNVPKALGRIGRALEGLAAGGMKRWRRRVPPIELLVCNKSTMRPGDRGLEFLSNYRRIPFQSLLRMPEAVKIELVDALHREIYSFPHWREILALFSLVPLTSSLPDVGRTASSIQSRFRSATGESLAHRRLKHFIFENPDVCGIRNVASKQIEQPLLSGDRVDVVLWTVDCLHAVEVKPPNAPEFEIIRGLFQCAKYRAVLTAEQHYQILQGSSPPTAASIKTHLVLGGDFPAGLDGLRFALDVELVQNLAVPSDFRFGEEAAATSG